MGVPRKDNRFLVVTGLSGSGKTVVSRFLEDLGYYCVDNLPTKLIPSFVDLWQKQKAEIERVALIVDIREPAFLTEFPHIFREIRKRISPRLIFLDASDECLVKRFSETRRPHPLARRRTVLEGVRLERRRMAEIMKMADEVIDTSALTISQLKERARPERPEAPGAPDAGRAHQLRLQVRPPAGLRPRLRHAVPAQPLLRRPPSRPGRPVAGRPGIRPRGAGDARPSSGSSSPSSTASSRSSSGKARAP